MKHIPLRYSVEELREVAARIRIAFDRALLLELYDYMAYSDGHLMSGSALSVLKILQCVLGDYAINIVAAAVSEAGSEIEERWLLGEIK